MNPTRETATADNNGDFDARQVAILLKQSTRQARGQFEPSPPWLLAIRAVGALGAYGALWLSVREQHPYSAPTAAAIPGAVAFGVVNLVATVAKRATVGITSSRLARMRHRTRGRRPSAPCPRPRDRPGRGWSSVSASSSCCSSMPPKSPRGSAGDGLP